MSSKWYVINVWQGGKHIGQMGWWGKETAKARAKQYTAYNFGKGVRFTVCKQS